MENTLIRGFVLFLALTGFGASSVTATTSTRVTVKPMGTNPLPTCLPGPGVTCGID